MSTWSCIGDPAPEPIEGVEMDRAIVAAIRDFRRPPSTGEVAWVMAVAASDASFVEAIERLVEGRSVDQALPRIERVGRRNRKIKIRDHPGS